MANNNNSQIQASVGTQGGVGALAAAGQSIDKGSKVFKTSVGDWMAGVMTLKEVLGEDSSFKQWVNGTGDLGDVIKSAVEIFSKTKIIDTIVDLTASVYGVRKELESSYGMFGARSDRFVKVISDQSQMTREFGISMRDNMKSYTQLADVLGTTEVGESFIGATSILEKSMDLSRGAASEIASKFSFMGASSQDMMGFMEGINKQATDIGLSPNAVAENIAGSTDAMGRFNLRVQQGRDKFAEVAIMATKMGVGIDKMSDAMSEFRTIGDAAAASARFSLAGINVNAMQLMADARKGDPTRLFKASMSRLGQMSDDKGRLDPVGIDMANLISKDLNMSLDEIQQALWRMKTKSPEDAAKYYKTLSDRAKASQSINEHMDNALAGLLDAIYPAADWLMKILDQLAQHKKVLQGILIATIGGWGVFKAATLLGKGRLALSAIGGWGGAGRQAGGAIPAGYAMAKQSLINRSLSNGAFSPYDPTQGGYGGYGGGSGRGTTGKGGSGRKGKGGGARIPGHRKKGGKAFKNAVMAERSMAQQAANASTVATVAPQSTATAAARAPRRAPVTANQLKKMQLNNEMLIAQAKRMGAAAVFMIAFGAAVWILSKAFQNFSTVNWKGFTYGVGAIGLLLGTMWILSKSTVGWEAIAMFGALAGVTWVLSKALQNISSAFTAFGTTIVSLANAKDGIAVLGWSLMGLASAMQVFGGGGLLGFAGMLLGTQALKPLGNFAATYAEPINLLATSLERLVSAMAALNSMEAKTINLKIDDRMVSALQRSSLSLYSNGSKDDQPVIETKITVELNGVQLAREIVSTPGVRIR